jgi:hypothetical protein
MIEAIQIQEEHYNFFLVPRRRDDRLLDPVAQKHSIGQAGQKIVLGRMSHQQGHRLRRTDVSKDNNRSGCVALAIVDRGNRVFNGNFKSVAADEHAVYWQAHDLVLTDRQLHWIWNRFTACSIQDSEHFGHRPAARFLPLPPRHFLCDCIQERDISGNVRANDGVAKWSLA